MSTSKAILVLIFSLGIFSLPAFAASKVEICHTPPGNPQQTETITVSENSLPAHLNHGDKVGGCFQSLCPCSGVGSDPNQGYDFTWDDTFDATSAVNGSCFVGDFGGEIRNNTGEFMGMDWDGKSGECSVGNDATFPDHRKVIDTQEQFDACAISLRQIALNDGKVCQ